MPQDKSVIAIIPVWNARDDLQTCLESLLKLKDNLRVVVADNNSTEPVDDIIKKYQNRFINQNIMLEYLKLDDNYGPTGAMNRALEKKYQGEHYILRIDSDVQISHESVISELISFMSAYPGIGLIGPKMIVPELNTNIVATFWSRFFGTIKNIDVDHPTETDLVNGGFMLIKSELYKKLGHLWSEILFYSWEELDLSERARKKGYKTFYYPDATVVHNIRTMRYRSEKQVYYDLRNLLLVNWKYGNAFSRLTIFFILFIPRLAYWVFFRAKYDFMTLFRAVRDFFVLRKKYINEYE
jgi:GT2 family glycosyltransferase